MGELFSLLHGEGIHTALDTSGMGIGICRLSVLEHTDLVLADLKFATPEEYRLHCKADMEKCWPLPAGGGNEGPLWVRHGGAGA